MLKEQRHLARQYAVCGVTAHRISAGNGVIRYRTLATTHIPKLSVRFFLCAGVPDREPAENRKNPATDNKE